VESQFVQVTPLEPEVFEACSRSSLLSFSLRSRSFSFLTDSNSFSVSSYFSRQSEENTGDQDSTQSSSDSSETDSTKNGTGSSSEKEDHPDLTEIQTELYNLVQDNPDEDVEWYADQMDQEPRLLKMWKSKIQKVEGYEDFSLE